MIETLRNIYDSALEQEMKERAGEGYVVTDDMRGKEYEGEGFFLCGFLAIEFTANTKANRGLLKQLRHEQVRVSEGYPRGFRFSVRDSYSNGGYELHREATARVVTYLNSWGFEVNNRCSMD